MRALCFCIAVSLAAGTIYLQTAKPIEPEWDWSRFFKMTESDGGWFDPSYSMRIPERWQIGSHTYTTRDLMGRPI